MSNADPVAVGLKSNQSASHIPAPVRFLMDIVVFKLPADGKLGIKHPHPTVGVPEEYGPGWLHHHLRLSLDMGPGADRLARRPVATGPRASSIVHAVHEATTPWTLSSAARRITPTHVRCFFFS